jgi:signal transduction histidine kinase
MNTSEQKYSAYCNLLPVVGLQEKQAVPAEDKGKNRSNVVASVKIWATGVLPRASIRLKIGIGYGLAVGIAILGTTAGLAIGEHHQRQALTQLKHAHQQEHLLKDLQTTVLQARSHSSRFAVVLGNSIWLRYEKERFVQSINQAKQLLSETEQFVNNSDNEAADTKQLRDLLKTYAITIEAYGNVTESLLQQTEPWTLRQDEILAAQQLLLTNSGGEVASTLDHLSEKLNQLIDAAQDQDQQAAISLERASSLRARIIVGSMLLSIAIAAVLALYTSHAIAQPIRSVTRVAQQVTEEANFTLRAPVTTRDEVGVLAISLNQLIERIGVYTQELKQAEAQLIQTEKMSSLGAMVAGVAHEINNPVNFIYGNLQYTSEYVQDLLSLLHLYQQDYPEPTPAIQDHLEAIDLDFLAEDLPKVLSSMKGGAERIREIVLSLRNFSRLDETGVKPVNLHEGIDNTLIILNSRLHHGIEVIKQYGDLPLVECSPALLNQVFMNLLCNAIDALELGTGKDSHLTPIPTIWIHTEALDQNWVVIKIADNGSGIPVAIQDRIFDPFFTTKEPGKGTGLGLAISYQIITQHQGKIEVISVPGKGAEFVITLPVHSSSRTSNFHLK